MANSTFIASYQQFLKQNHDPTRAKKEKAYLYSDLNHYGLTTAKRETFFKQHRQDLSQLTKNQALQLVQGLWDQPSFEARIGALDILKMHQDQLISSDLPLIETLMRQSRGWALLDNLIIPLMPPLLTQDPSLYHHLTRWIQDNDFWVRRSALLAQLLFFRRGVGGNRQLFFKLAVSQFDESWIELVYPDTLTKKRARFFIRKAIGWTLREMSLKNPQLVVDFLNQYKTKMAPFIYREASRRLSEVYRRKLT